MENYIHDISYKFSEDFKVVQGYHPVQVLEGFEHKNETRALKDYYAKISETFLSHLNHYMTVQNTIGRGEKEQLKTLLNHIIEARENIEEEKDLKLFEF